MFPGIMNKNNKVGIFFFKMEMVSRFSTWCAEAHLIARPLQPDDISHITNFGLVVGGSGPVS